MSLARGQNIGFLGFANSGKTTLFSHLRNRFSSVVLGEEDDFHYFAMADQHDEVITVWDLKCDVSASKRQMPDVIYNTKLVFIIYDVTNAASLDISYYYRIKCMLADLNCKVVLVGNKLDLAQNRVIPKDSVEKMRRYYKLDDEIEISAIEPSGLVRFTEAFDRFFKNMLSSSSQAKIQGDLDHEPPRIGL